MMILALKYMETAWQAARYQHDAHPEVFLGIGIPDNIEIISIDEIREMGEKISEMIHGYRSLLWITGPSSEGRILSSPASGI